MSIQKDKRKPSSPESLLLSYLYLFVKHPVFCCMLLLRPDNPFQFLYIDTVFCNPHLSQLFCDLFIVEHQFTTFVLF